MKKLIFTLLTFFVFSLPALPETLKTGITYSVESAKKIAFENVKKRLPKDFVKPHLVDPFFDENKDLIKKNITETDDRIIEFLSNGDYCITYKDDLYTTFFYNSIGKSNGVVINTKPNAAPPCKSLMYAPSGKLLSVIYIPVENEVYAFNEHGKKWYYVIDNIMYDANNNPVDIIED